jgi:hypothetical protein
MLAPVRWAPTRSPEGCCRVAVRCRSAVPRRDDDRAGRPYDARTTADVASTFPREFSARTANRVAEVRTSTRVSKLRLAADPAGFGDPLPLAASTYQRATVVAPFQLAYTATCPPVPGLATAFGRVVGVALHGKVNSR